jgi:hypothetical protein
MSLHVALSHFPFAVALFSSVPDHLVRTLSGLDLFSAQGAMFLHREVA